MDHKEMDMTKWLTLLLQSFSKGHPGNRLHFLKDLNIHIVVQQKPTQHYEAIILQLKIKKFFNVKHRITIWTSNSSPKYIYHPPEKKAGTRENTSTQVFSSYLFFCGHTVWHVGSWLPDQGQKPLSLQWKRGVSATGRPGEAPTQMFTAALLP